MPIAAAAIYEDDEHHRAKGKAAYRRPFLLGSELLARVAHVPDRSRSVIRHEKRSVLCHGYAYRSAPDVAVCSREPGQEVLIFARCLAIFDRHTDDFVSCAVRFVPRSVLGGKGIAL